MAIFKSESKARFAHLMVALPLVLAAIVISPVPAGAQGVDSDLSKQLSQLQVQVARLEAALNHQPEAAASMTQQPNAEGNQATVQEQRIPGVPEGMQITASYQNCLQCHQTRPAGPLPPSHLEALSVSGQGGTQAAGGQESSGAGMGQMAQGGQGMQGMGGGKGMGMGMMGGGKGMGSGQGMQGMDGGKGMGMGMKSGGMGMGGDKKMGMGGGKGMGMMGEGGMSMGDSSQDSQSMNAMGGGGSMGGSAEKPMESQMQQMEQQIQQLQQQMQQMMQIQMQMQLIQMKTMQSN